MSTVFVNIGLSVDGYMAPEGMTMENWDKPEYKNWGAKWGALMRWTFTQQFFREKLKLGFEEMVQEAVEQAARNRNTTVAKHLLIPFSGTRYFKAIATYLVEKGAVSYEVANARVTIRLSTKRPKGEM